MNAVLWIVAGLAVLSGPQFSVGADRESFRKEVTGLLKDGWPANTPALKNAETHLAAAEAAADDDFRPRYAFALIQLRALKFTEARATMDELVKQFPNELSVRQTHFWVTLLQRDYGGSLPSAIESAKLLSAGNNDKDPFRKDAAVFLGRTFGFLGGLSGPKVPTASINEAEQKILAVLTPGFRAAYDEGRLGVREKRETLAAEKEKVQDAAKAVEAREKAAELEKIAATRADMKAELDAQAQKVQTAGADLGAAQAKLKKDGDYLQAQFSDLERRAAPLKAKIDRADREARSLESDADRAERDKDKDKDGKGKSSNDDPRDLRRQAEKVRDSVKKEEGEFDQLDSKARGLRLQYAQLQAQVGVAAQNVASEQDRLAATKKQQQRDERLLKSRELKAKAPPQGSTVEVRLLEAKNVAVGTYVPLFIEQERQRILDSLEK